MNRHYSKALWILVLTSLFSASSIASASNTVAAWEKLSDEDGIQTWRKEVPGSEIVALRGEAVMDASVAKIAAVLADTSRKLEWVAKIVEAKDVRLISEDERIEYNRTAAPWPVKDRDFVFHAKVEADMAKRSLIVKLKSVEDPAAPETDCVRGQLHSSSYILTCLDAGCTKTNVVVEVQVDPKGSIPKWVVNLFQKAWPRKTLEGIRAQAARPDVKEVPRVKALFAPAAART